MEMKGVVEEEQEEQKQPSKEEEVVAEERKTTAATEQQEQAGDKPINQFRLETIERRASNEVGHFRSLKIMLLIRKN